MPTTARAVRLRPAADVVCRHLNGGAVLIDLETHRIFELNETGARVWDCLRRGESVPQAAAFVDELRDNGLLEAQVWLTPDVSSPAAGIAWDPAVDPPRLRARGTVSGILDAGGGKLPEC
jgi:hypothetical protein